MTELQRLEFLDGIIWVHSRNGLTALATQHYLHRQFYGLPEDEMKQVFWTNVGNNILYQANDALIDQSIVAIVEHIKTEDRIAPLPVEIPDRTELRKHRIVISHPGTVKFGEAEVQRFYDDDQHYKDIKAVRIWRSRQSLVNKLRELGSTRVLPNEVVVQPGTVDLIRGALAASLRQPELLPINLSELVTSYFSKYGKAIAQWATEGKPEPTES